MPTAITLVKILNKIWLVAMKASIMYKHTDRRADRQTDIEDLVIAWPFLLNMMLVLLMEICWT